MSLVENKAELLRLDAPIVGFGTIGLEKEMCELAVTTAIQAGCQLIDTSEHYNNLDQIGTALSAVDSKPFIVLKLSGLPSGAYEVAKARVIAMLRKLGIDKGDCILIHWPGLCDWDPTDSTPLDSAAAWMEKAAVSTWDCFCDNITEAWANMMKLREEGLVDQVGVSNFYPHHLEELTRRCPGAVPFMNQIFISATNQEAEFVAQMQAAGIRVQAYRPLICGSFPESVTKIAERLGTTPQIVVLGWLLKRGIFPLAKSRGHHSDSNINNSQRIKELLTDEDVSSIAAAEEGMRYSPEWFAKKWKFHNEVLQGANEEDVQMLAAMGIDEAKAREALEKCGGDMDAAMDMCIGS